MTRIWIAVIVMGSGLARAADPVPSTAAVTGVAVVSATSCVLHADGAVSCWGRDLDRTAKTPIIHSRPIGVPALHDVIALEGVFFGICGLHRDGTVTCLGMLPSSSGAPELQPLKGIVALHGTCALGSDGHVTCFDSKTWTRVPHLDDAIDAHGGERTGCAVHKDTTVSCWSAEKADLIGGADDGSPRLVAGVKDAVQVGAGLFFGCARLRDGRVTCWGDNNAGELGRGATDETSYHFHPPAPIAGVTDAVDLMAGAAHACIRRKAGAMACWGQLPWTFEKQPRATSVKSLTHISAFAGGDQHCAVGTGRDVWCFGVDRNGELGNGMSAIQEVALEISGVRDAIQIYATTLGTCAVHRTGGLTCWGDKSVGTKLPPISHLSQAIRVFSGGNLTGLDRAGRLWINGESVPRKLPKGTTHSGPCVIANGGEVWCNAIVPGRGHGPVTGQLAGVTDAVEIAGEQRMLVRHRSGAVSTFAVDDALDGRTATAVPAIDDAISLAGGSRIDCAVRADHTVWCWGAESPLLGHAASKVSNAQLPPAPIAGITDVASVAISDEMATESVGFICAVKLDRSVACWGENRHGQAGGGPSAVITKPVAIRGVHDATQVAVGWLHACALENTGAITCWGSTEEGAGGTSPTERIDHPVAVLW